MFLTSALLKCAEWGLLPGGVAIPSNRVNVSYVVKIKVEIGDNIFVAIPSNRVNVSYDTYLFLRIIGNLTPLFREPHYFYAFFFPI